MWTAGARQRIPPRLDAPIGLTRHGAAGACSAFEAPIGVGERSGRLRPYVRPVARCSPLAIMGVRVRVRRQSGSRARGTPPSTASPELPRPQPSASRRSALAAGSGGLAPAVYRARREVIRFPADVFGDGSCGVTQPVGWASACGRRTRGGGGGTLERGGAGGAVPRRGGRPLGPAHPGDLAAGEGSRGGRGGLDDRVRGAVGREAAGAVQRR